MQHKHNSIIYRHFSSNYFQYFYHQGRMDFKIFYKIRYWKLTHGSSSHTFVMDIWVGIFNKKPMSLFSVSKNTVGPQRVKLWVKYNTTPATRSRRLNLLLHYLWTQFPSNKEEENPWTLDWSISYKIKLHSPFTIRL